ncbi:MAG: segregation/condensation protein A [bacterium]
MAYRIKLENFEGPLDLLLFLIKKNEVDIYDIPIAPITRQYLEYVQLMQVLDLDFASEFILMAATLIRIKAQMLLPKPQIAEEMEEIDPRQELMARLLEYRKYKEIAHELGRRESKHRLYHPRTIAEADYFDDETGLEFGQVTLYDLLSAFNEVLRRFENQPVHQVITPRVSVDEQIKFIKAFVKDRDQISFSQLLQQVHLKTRAAVIGTLIALLELIRSKSILVKQSGPFSEIWIFNPSASN